MTTLRLRNASAEEERPEPGQSPRRAARSEELRPQHGLSATARCEQPPSQHLALQFRQGRNSEEHAGDVRTPGPRSYFHRAV